MKASAYGHVDVVDTLIQAGTIVNLKKTNGQTALAIAVFNQQHKIINKLLLAGADPTIKDKVQERNYHRGKGGYCILTSLP